MYFVLFFFLKEETRNKSQINKTLLKKHPSATEGRDKMLVSEQSVRENIFT